MKMHFIVIGILIIGMLTLGMTTYVSDLGTEYNTTADMSTINNTASHLESQQNLTVELRDTITSFKLENPADFIAIPYKMIKVGWQSIKLVFGSFTSIEAIMSDSTSALRDVGITLPGWLLPSVFAIVMIILISILIYGLFKWKFSD